MHIVPRYQQIVVISLKRWNNGQNSIDKIKNKGMALYA